MARTKTIPYVWATNAAGVDIADPGQVKQELGWVSEKPPHQFFNFTLNAMSDVLKSAEENGIIEWLVSTNYTLGALTWEAGTSGTPGGGIATNGASWATSDQTQAAAYTILLADDTIRQIYTGAGEHTFTLDAGTQAANFTCYVANAGTGRVLLSDGTDDIKIVWPADMTYKVTWDAGRNQFDVSEV